MSRTENGYACKTQIIIITWRMKMHISLRRSNTYNVTVLQWCSFKFGTGGTLRSPSPPPFPSPTIPCPLPLPFHPVLSPFPSLRSRPLKSSYGVGVSNVSSPRGYGAEPSQNRIWCILALRCDIWWQQFQWFSCESTHRSLLPWYHLWQRRPTKNIWGNSVPVLSPSTTPLLLPTQWHPRMPWVVFP